MAKNPAKIKRSYVHERVAFERENDNSAFYNSRAWRNLRKGFLSKFPLCIVCEAKGLTVVATVADHVVTINAGGDSMSENNLQPMCKSCHNSKSSSESRGYGVKSR